MNREIQTRVAQDLALNHKRRNGTSGLTLDPLQTSVKMTSIFKSILECFSYTFTRTHQIHLKISLKAENLICILANVPCLSTATATFCVCVLRSSKFKKRE